MGSVSLEAGVSVLINTAKLPSVVVRPLELVIHLSSISSGLTELNHQGFNFANLLGGNASLSFASPADWERLSFIICLTDI